MVDSQGRIRFRGRSFGNRQEGVPGRDRLPGLRRIYPPNLPEAAKRKSHFRLGPGGRLRRRLDQEQHLFHGMASPVREATGVPGGGPGRVVYDPGRERKNLKRAGSIPGGIKRDSERAKSKRLKPKQKYLKFPFLYPVSPPASDIGANLCVPSFRRKPESRVPGENRRQVKQSFYTNPANPDSYFRSIEVSMLVSNPLFSFLV